MKASSRFWIFLYGKPNILGSIAGIIGVIMFFTGFIGSYWLLIVIGLYWAGFFMAYALTPSKKVSFVDKSAIDVPSTISALDAFSKKLKLRVLSETHMKVDSIARTIGEILPRVENNPTQSSVIMQIASDYLPKMFENYLSLPPTFARVHPVKDGKTSKDLLVEQLDILDSQIKKIASDVYSNDAEALARHGQFLKDKFVQKEDWLDL